MKTALVVIILAFIVAALLSGCATPRIGFGYDFLNQRVTVSVEPGDGKRVVKPER
jgi:predicted small secreted protein